MAQKITHWLLITLVLSLGFGQLLRFDFFGIPIYLHDLLVICILVLQGLTLKGEPNPAYTRVGEGQTLKVLVLGLSLGWLFAILHYSLPQLLIPFLYTLRLLAYLSLYLILKQSKILVSKVYFLASGSIALFIGYLQYFLLPDMRLFQYLGWDDHLNRLTLPHFDPTFTAVMLALYILSNTNYSSLYAVSCKLFAIIAILLTYSRSVWLSLVLTGFMFIKNKLVLLFAVSCMLLAIFALPQKFGEGTNLLRTFSISSRLESDIAYVKKYKWDLLVGRGMNTLILDASQSQYDNHATGPNNSYLYLLLTSGILGLIGWGMFMYSLYTRSSHKPMLIFFFIASLFNNVMFYPFALLWVLLLETQSTTLENLRI